MARGKLIVQRPIDKEETIPANVKMVDESTQFYSVVETKLRPQGLFTRLVSGVFPWWPGRWQAVHCVREDRIGMKLKNVHPRRKYKAYFKEE